VTDVENMLRLEKLLAHGGKKVGASGQDANAFVFAQVGDGLRESARADELEVREAHTNIFSTEDTEGHRGANRKELLCEPSVSSVVKIFIRSAPNLSNASPDPCL
jgi:hypothetical protein